MLYNLNNLRRFGENACVLQRDEVQETTYSYNNIIAAVECLLGDLHQNNIPESITIALQLKQQTPATCVLMLGILNHNCHYYPLDADVTAERGNECLCKSGACFLITDGVVHPKLMVKKTNTILRILDEEFTLRSVELKQYATAFASSTKWCYIIGTSGSTGTPKMVFVPYACIAPNVHALRARLQLTQNDVILLAAPLTFDPFVIEFFMALSCGAALLLTTTAIRKAPDKLLRVLFKRSKHNVTILQTTPSLFRLFGTAAIRETILISNSSLRALLLGGEEFSNVEELKTWLPCKSTKTRIFNIYGITEVSCWSTIFECDLKHIGIYKRIPLGAAIDAETELRIVDIGTGNTLLGAGQGELCVGSATRKCYMPQVDSVAFGAEVVIYRNTGDLVERAANGELYYIGRLNNTIKRLGKRLCLAALNKTIEDLLLPKVPTLLRAICLWNKETKQLHCCLVAPDCESVDQRACKRLLLEQLAHYEKPDSIVFRQTVPINAHGKVNCKALLTALQATNAQQPVSILKHFLGETLALATVEKPPAHKRAKNDLSFTAAGGTSYHALSLASEIGKWLQNANDQRQLLKMLLDESVTIANLFEFLECAEVASGTPTKTQPINAGEQKTLKLLWRINLGKCVDATPTLFEQKYICIGAHSHLLLTIDAASGNVLQRLTLPDRIECGVSYATDTHLAFVGCYDGYLYAFDLRQADRIAWRINVGGMIKAKPLIYRRAVVVVSYGHDFNLACISLETQKTIWHRKLGNKGIFAAPILLREANAMLCCTLDGTYAQLDATTGDIMWLQQCATPIFATPALSCCNDKQFFIAEVCGKLHFCCATDGAIRHTYNAAGNIFSSIVVHALSASEELIIFGCHDQHVYCISNTFQIDAAADVVELKAPNLLWKICLGSAIFSTPTLLQHNAVQLLVVCTTKGVLAILDLRKGFILAQHALPADIYSTPCSIADGRICFGCRDNFVYCFSIE